MCKQKGLRIRSQAPKSITGTIVLQLKQAIFKWEFHIAVSIGNNTFMSLEHPLFYAFRYHLKQFQTAAVLILSECQTLKNSWSRKTSKCHFFLSFPWSKLPHHTSFDCHINLATTKRQPLHTSSLHVNYQFIIGVASGSSCVGGGWKQTCQGAKKTWKKKH